MAEKPRLIDKLPDPPQPGKILVMGLGVPRSGTKSIKTALDILGIPTYHTSTALSNQEIGYLNEAIAAKYGGKGRPYDSDDWQKLLWRYQGIIDTPAIFFMEEHLANHPDAKVILNTRDFDSWFRSFSNSGFEMTRWRSWRILGWISSDPSLVWYRYGCTLLNILSGQGYKTEPRHDLWTRENYKATYDAHYPRVRSLVPEDRLLEYNVSEGWEPLCKFLGKEIPDQPFPRLNASEEIKDQRWQMLRNLWIESSINIFKMVSISGFAAALLGYTILRLKGRPIPMDLSAIKRLISL